LFFLKETKKYIFIIFFFFFIFIKFFLYYDFNIDYSCCKGKKNNKISNEYGNWRYEDLLKFFCLANFCANNDSIDEVKYRYAIDKLDIESLIYNHTIGFCIGSWDWLNRNLLYS